jgi:hypothetical protein
MSKKPEEIRIFNFSDAALMQLADAVISTGRRDATELGPEGVTSTRLDDLETLNASFRDMEDDIEWAGLVSEKTAEKDAALAECETGVRNIRRMAANIFGERSTKYKRFGFDSINALKDVERIKAYFRVHRRAVDNALALAPEGLTATVLTAFRDACVAADEAYDVLKDTIDDRDLATAERVVLGNAIYTEVVKICNTGKTYWFDRSEAKYNDYVITPGGGTEGGVVPPVATITISGTLTNGMTSTPIASGNLAVVVGADSYTATSNAAGFFARAIPAPAVPTAATMTAAATGFIGQSRALTLAPGVDQTQNFGLMPLPMPPTP